MTPRKKLINRLVDHIRSSGCTSATVLDHFELEIVLRDLIQADILEERSDPG